METKNYRMEYEFLEKTIQENEEKLRELKSKYFLDKLFAKGFFRDEYRKFKEKTGKILISEYIGGKGMDIKDYKFRFVDKDAPLTKDEKEFSDDFIFEKLVVKLYDKLNNHLTISFDKLLSDTFNIEI